ncbi:c-type cytochrome [Thalassobaculum sp. OXR-137]|uniref:c-type cytochrome n=1 Tax=Thalassobaculum sp. OXR-137 TaxID=3100173 RepID=UPI002AC8B722|nr:c-type cytochrome [Thalassobaculum sp. OXR-137]WPZ33707.1 c-type cytochrome [Thalassobaculum sp. OXR-137]
MHRFLITLAAAGLNLLCVSSISLAADTPVERGAYLMNAVAACGNCHTPFGPQGPDMSKALSGRLMEDNAVWTVYASNITPDMETGIGGWSDAEIVRAIREGVRPDGSVIGPPMPIGLYRGMSDADAMALVAYLRSLPAVKNETPASVYRVPVPPSWGPPVGHVAAPDPADAVAYGGYLAGPVAHCVECHSSPGATGAPDVVNALGGGGLKFQGPWGESVAPNLTPLGLADWTDAEIATAVRSGVAKDGRKLLPPMGYGYYAHMSDSDMAAIIAYLRSLPEK